MISVVIPVFDRDGSLLRAIDSVMRQPGVAGLVDEVVVVDDGSTIDMAALLTEMAGPVPLRLIRHEHNRGVCAAKNTGVRSARGRYVILLDSDDVLLDGVLPRLDERLRHDGPDALFCQSVTDDGGRLGKMPEGECDFETLLCAEDVGEYLPVVLRDALLETPFDERLRGFEGLTWLGMVERGRRIVFCDLEARGYDDRGTDRLCHPDNIVADAHRLAQGYRTHLDRFGRAIAMRCPAKYRRLCLRLLYYSLVARCPDALEQRGVRMPLDRTLPVLRGLYRASAWLPVAALGRYLRDIQIRRSH